MPTIYLLYILLNKVNKYYKYLIRGLSRNPLLYRDF